MFQELVFLPWAQRELEFKRRAYPEQPKVQLVPEARDTTWPKLMKL